MRQNIANEIKSAGMFSIQINTTQDVKVEVQCSTIIRYLTDSVKERLIGPAIEVNVNVRLLK